MSCVEWTTGEVDALREHYPAHGPNWDGWDELLPNRTRAAVSSMAARLRVRHRHVVTWTKAEEEAVRLHYARRGPNWDGWDDLLLPGHSKGQLVKKASQMGVNCKRRFSEEDDRALVRLAGEMARQTGHGPTKCCKRAYTLLHDYEKKTARGTSE